MKKLLIALATVVAAQPVFAQNITASGTQGYSCTVVGATNIPLISAGNNALSGSAQGSIEQNANTTYTLSNASVTGPDENKGALVVIDSNALTISATETNGNTANVVGPVSQTVSIDITVDSGDGVLDPGTYTVEADLSCAATP